MFQPLVASKKSRDPADEGDVKDDELSSIADKNRGKNASKSRWALIKKQVVSMSRESLTKQLYMAVENGEDPDPQKALRLGKVSTRTSLPPS
jgi:hypothetical protein